MAVSTIATKRPFKVVAKASSTIASMSGTGETTIDTTEDGWVALGIVGWQNGGNSSFYPYTLRFMGNNTIKVQLRNITSGTLTNVSLTADVLYMKA